MGAITSQNDATPKLLGGRIAPGRERLPVKTTLLQNSRSSTETLIHERLPVKTTLLQNVQRKISFVFIERLPVKTTLLQNCNVCNCRSRKSDYQSKRRYSKTDGTTCATTSRSDYQSKRRYSKTYPCFVA